MSLRRGKNLSLLCRPVCYEEPVYQEESVSCDFGSVIRSVGACWLHNRGMRDNIQNNSVRKGCGHILFRLFVKEKEQACEVNSTHQRRACHPAVHGEIRCFEQHSVSYHGVSLRSNPVRAIRT